ncbi:tyrosine protein phosphatase [candidate division KSB3 bacterium]|uniref:protein-tyrosine-phosphatase n=1 Tax=candidate division KSB3 bacterium TaxID=2044937 RepID=A0A2G6KGD6_9BACT|nr:MAG: tyrosine protein phosphatase [candidate division KSB3 bacterium]
MIDIHCHILPGVDDGAENVTETLDMCRLAIADGITTIVATPHQQDGVYNTSCTSIEEQLDVVKGALRDEKLALELLPGADVHIDVHTSRKIQQGEIMTINGTGRYFLLEFPAHSIPPNIDKIIFDLMLKNIIPILTHPERIDEVQENPSRVYDLVSMGVLSQITAMSITGGFGRRAQKCAKTLLKHNLAHIIATDAHSTKSRPPILSEAVKVAGQIVGTNQALEMVTTIPQQIVHGKAIAGLSAPIPIKRRFWGMF